MPGAGFLIRAVVSLVAIAIVISQCRKPKWFVGRAYLRAMNRSHAALTSWGLTHVSIGKGDTILDVGCGGGQTIRTLAASASDGKVFGLDYSPESVNVSRHVNSDLIATGRVDVQPGSVSSLPYPDSTFDLVTAVETHYYWPDPVHDLREILRVLKPGGKLLMIAEVYRRNQRDVIHPAVMKVLGGRCPGVDEFKAQFAAAGYASIEFDERRGKGWICALGVKDGSRTSAAT